MRFIGSIVGWRRQPTISEQECWVAKKHATQPTRFVLNRPVFDGYRSFFLVKILGIAGHQRAPDQRHIIPLVDRTALIAQGRHQIFGFVGDIAIAEHLVGHAIAVSAGLIRRTCGALLLHTTIDENRFSSGSLAIPAAASRQTDK
jgi:hypothetical protein